MALLPSTTLVEQALFGKKLHFILQGRV